MLQVSVEPACLDAGLLSQGPLGNARRGAAALLSVAWQAECQPARLKEGNRGRAGCAQLTVSSILSNHTPLPLCSRTCRPDRHLRPLEGYRLGRLCECWWVSAPVPPRLTSSCCACSPAPARLHLSERQPRSQQCLRSVDAPLHMLHASLFPPATALPRCLHLCERKDAEGCAGCTDHRSGKQGRLHRHGELS